MVTVRKTVSCWPNFYMQQYLIMSFSIWNPVLLCYFNSYNKLDHHIISFQMKESHYKIYIIGSIVTNIIYVKGITYYNLFQVYKKNYFLQEKPYYLYSWKLYCLIFAQIFYVIFCCRRCFHRKRWRLTYFVPVIVLPFYGVQRFFLEQIKCDY